MTKKDYINNSSLLEQLPVFYQPWYLNIFGDNWDVKLFEGKEQTWIFPYFIEKKAGISINRPPMLTPYHGPFCLNETKDLIAPIEAEESIIKELTQFAKQFGIFAICPHFKFRFDALSSQKMQSKARVTHFLKLDPTKDDLFAAMDYARRKNVKKAERELVIKEAVFNVDDYFEWINATYQKRGGTQPFPKSFFEKYVKTVLEHQAGIANTIYNNEGAAISMSLVLLDKVSAYSILGANNPAHKHNAATTALLWKSIEQAKDLNCSIFDFEGSSIPEIAHFFSKFGGERVDYKGWEQTNSLLWKLKTKILG